MSQRADFMRYDFPGGQNDPPQLAVPRADVEQRVILSGAGAIPFRIATSAAAAATGSAYLVRTSPEPFILAPGQDLWVTALGVTQLSVYIAPAEDDYLESGQIWHDHG